jgi:redox-sensitive bicupin YhaK (pirin superfamily)
MIIEPRLVKLSTRTGVEVKRSIPHAKLKTIGAWCFIDHFGPTQQTDGMVVAKHPHIGLQTVTWLIEGKVEHRDSLGSVQEILPGQVNIMTAGKGISHSELSQIGPENLHAVQLWVALPQQFSGIQPLFEHRADLPAIQLDGTKATVFAGDFGDSSAKMTIFSELVGLELDFEANANLNLPLRPDFEYGLLMIGGSVEVNGLPIAENDLLYIEVGASELNITTTTPAKAILVGGVPFGEKIVMWWNFVASSQKEITEAREQWNARDARFGDFEDQIGGWIPAPELPHVNLQPR